MIIDKYDNERDKIDNNLSFQCLAQQLQCTIYEKVVLVYEVIYSTV